MNLEALNLGRRTDDRWLLKDVDLTIQDGDQFAIVGPTGSGKTLLLRALAVLDPLDTGQLLWNGNPVRGKDVPRFRSQVIYLHQRPALFDGSVEDILRKPFDLQVHQRKQFDRQNIEKRLACLGRDGSFLKKQQRDLSGGEAQWVALLRAIQLNPNVLLLDEPTAALDAESSRAVESLVAGWLDEMADRATVWVTHDRQQAHRVSKSIFHVRDGQLSRGDK